jgi:hypothetical protein
MPEMPPPTQRCPMLEKEAEAVSEVVAKGERSRLVAETGRWT